MKSVRLILFEILAIKDFYHIWSCRKKSTRYSVGQIIKVVALNPRHVMFEYDVSVTYTFWNNRKQRFFTKYGHVVKSWRDDVIKKVSGLSYWYRLSVWKVSDPYLSQVLSNCASTENHITSSSDSTSAKTMICWRSMKQLKLLHQSKSHECQ